MRPLATTLDHRFLLPERSGNGLHPTILLLHGRGSDEEDLLSLAESLDERFLLISARAPFAFPSGGYTWYEVQESGDPHQETFLASYGKLSRFLDDVSAGYPVDRERILLLGFSMGTVMSYALALTRPALIRGVAASSGYLPEVPFLSYRWQELGHTAFFISHGTEDPIIPVAMARRARALLESAGAPLVYREYPMPHTISEQSLRDIAAWTTGFLP